MKRLKMTSGSWLVVGLVGAALVLAVVAMKVRRFPRENRTPATTRAVNEQPKTRTGATVGVPPSLGLAGARIPR